MNNINNDIKNKTFKPVYLICGTEDYLKKQMKDNLKNALSGDDDINTLEMNEKADINEIVSFGSTLPFLSPNRLIILDRTDIFKKSFTYKDENGRERKISDFIDDMPDYLHIIIVDEAPDKRTSLYKSINKKGYVCEINKQTVSTLTKYISGRCKENGKSIDDVCIKSIIARTDSDLGIINGELEKLFAYTAGKDSIDSHDIDAVCSVCVENRIFDMIKALGVKDKKKVYELYFDLLTLKEPAMKILILMQRAFSGILQAKEGKGKIDRKTLAGSIGLKGVAPFVAANYLSQADNFTTGQLKKIVESFARTEEDIKTGRIDERTGTELMIAMALE